MACEDCIMDIEQLVAAIAREPSCIIDPPGNLPIVDPAHTLQEDLKQFYELCGGLSLFTSSAYGLRIVGPDEVVPANPIIVGDLYPEDISSTWYIIAQDPGGDYYTIDLHPDRLGRCYDSFWDRHAVAGSSTIVALSFLEFLQRMLENKGDHWYFAKPDFVEMGDAYCFPS